MKRFFFALVFITSNANAQSTYFPPVIGSAWDTVSPAALGWCPEKVDSLIEYVGNTNAKAFIVLKDGRIVIEHYYDSFTVDSFWYWASAGKSLTAFLIGLAQEQGYLNINDSLPKYLGHGFSSCGIAAEDSIRIIHQLTMTSGLDDLYGGFGSENHCTDDSCLHCIEEPGTRWAYHNAPYTMTHWVLDSATQVDRNVFTFNNLYSSCGISGLWAYSGYNDVFFSKARSFARFGLLIQNHGVWDNDTIMHDQDYFNAMINTSQNINLSYGYLWWLNGKASYRLPNTQFTFNGPIVPHAPADMIAALGKNNQMLNIVPSMGLVVVRMGEPMFGTQEVPNAAVDSIWVKLNAAMCLNSGVVHSAGLVSDVTIFPNPANDELTIRGNSNQITGLEIFNSIGQLVYASATKSFEYSVNTSQFSDGVYFVCVKSAGVNGVIRGAYQVHHSR